MLNEGDKFTITGLKALPDGRIIYDCAPGEETVFAADVPIPIAGSPNHHSVICKADPPIKRTKSKKC